MVVVITSDYEPIYTGPGTEYLFLAWLNSGIHVQVIGRSGDGNWLVVHLPYDTIGWLLASQVGGEVDQSLLETFETPPTPLPTFTPVPVPRITIEEGCPYCPPGTNYPYVVVSLENFKPGERVVLTIFDPEGNEVHTASGTTFGEEFGPAKAGTTWFVVQRGNLVPGTIYLFVVEGDEASYAQATFAREGAPEPEDEDEDDE